MVLYIHGFASSGKGQKALRVSEYFKKEAFTPSLPYKPELAIDTLTQIAEHLLKLKEPLFLIGSSLGGYYATYLSERYDLPAVLINPSVEPYITLAPYVGEVRSFYDLSSFEWTQRDIEYLKRLRIKTPIKRENYLLMLQTGDETLDYRVAQKFYEGALTILEEGGSHAFEGFENHLKDIKKFFNSKERSWRKI